MRKHFICQNRIGNLTKRKLHFFKKQKIFSKSNSGNNNWYLLVEQLSNWFPTHVFAMDLDQHDLLQLSIRNIKSAKSIYIYFSIFINNKTKIKTFECFKQHSCDLRNGVLCQKCINHLYNNNNIKYEWKSVKNSTFAVGGRSTLAFVAILWHFVGERYIALEYLFFYPFLRKQNDWFKNY